MRDLPETFKGLPVVLMGALVAALISISCAAQAQKGSVDSNIPEMERVSSVAFDDAGIEKLLMAEYKRWKGTRHELGGNGSDGVDCSGFVKAVFKKVFQINLPRTTTRQVRIGSAVDVHELRAGDLVFFRPPSYPRHVGIYLSENKFMHASKGKGVIVSSLDQTYWRKCVWTARRILSH